MTWVLLGLGTGWAQQTVPAEPSTAPAQGVPTTSLEEAERLFLAGHMSARELQRSIARFHAERKEREAAERESRQEQAILVLRASEADPAKNPPPGPALKAEQLPMLEEEVAPPTNVDEEDFIDIETRMDALLREKRERELQSSNRVTAAREVPAKSMTKRRRLDAILRLYIEGELTEAQYKQQRAEIIAEKE